MTDNQIALTVNLDEDLLPLSAMLQQRGVPHKIFEKQGQQVLAVAHSDQVPAVQAMYQAWHSGDLEIELVQRTSVKAPVSDIKWSRSPVTVMFAVVAVAVFLGFYIGLPQHWITYLTYSPFSVAGDQLVFAAMNGEYWRFITPIFLHFGWLHIVFNTLWLWELGSRVERAVGSLNTLFLVLVIALVSNTSQYVMTGPSLFGGLSGVVYGLLGFAWVAPLLQPRWEIQPTPAIMLFMVGWLLVCLFGVVEVLGFGAIANAAHVGGLLCGALLGLALGALSRLTDRP